MNSLAVEKNAFLNLPDFWGEINPSNCYETDFV
jgi:hypothetical protein